MTEGTNTGHLTADGALVAIAFFGFVRNRIRIRDRLSSEGSFPLAALKLARWGSDDCGRLQEKQHYCERGIECELMIVNQGGMVNLLLSFLPRMTRILTNEASPNNI